MDQLGFEGMPTRLFTCTPSRLGSWLDCPRRYRMTYLDRPQPPKGPAWAHNSFGASVHNALAGWWRLPRPRRSVPAAGALVTQCWITDGYQDARQAARHRDRAVAMVERYVGQLDPDQEPVGVERTVATRTRTLALSGRVDRLDERVDEQGPHLVVVDYKTGRRPLSVDDARGSLALALYALAAARSLRRPARRVELHHLPTGETPAWEHSDAALARALDRAERIAGEISTATEQLAADTAAGRHGPRDDLFPPRPGPMCSWCDFAQHCPEGLAASVRREPWDGLPDT
jgi:RecB family exonuclease